MDLPRALRASMADALAPTATDVMRAREMALDALAGGKVLDTNELIEKVLAQSGLERSGARHERIEITGPHEDSSADLNAPQIVRSRLATAVREAVAELQAQGLIAPAAGMQQPEEVLISVQRRGQSWGERFAIVHPTIDRHYRLLRPYVDRADFPLFDAQTYKRAAAELLGVRGGRCIDEAIAAHRHGLWLSSANMLGAASEAAWFTTGELLRGRNENLDQALDSDVTVRVIATAVDMLGQMTTRHRGTLAELQAHAAYLRDLRNYGLHPRATSDDDRELAFTEQGSALLLMQSRRYFARMHEVTVAAGLHLDEVATDR